MSRSSRGAQRDELLLRHLRNSNGYASGEELSNRLGITRAALWKRVDSLRRRGFVIEAKRGRGYRLIEAPDLSAEDLMATASGGLAHSVAYFDKTTSTNDLASELAAQGAQEGTVVLADSQSAGRGRLGRRWVSPPGANLYMSVVLRPGLTPQDAPLLTLLCAVACARTLRALSGVDARIKWPNDIVVRGKKLGGILIETRAEPDRITHAVAGLGLNINMKKSALPAELKKLATSVLIETGRRHARTPIAAGILNEMASELELLRTEGKGQLLKSWRELSDTLGRRVKVVMERETLKGLARDIDDEGRLLVKTSEGKLRRVSSGDLTMLR